MSFPQYFQYGGYTISSELRDFGRSVFVYIVRQGNNRGRPDQLLQFNSESDTVTEVDLEEGARLPDRPTFQVPALLLTDLIGSLQAAVQSTGADPVPSESKIQGKLEATERHLQDLRRLVFKEFTGPQFDVGAKE
jgi:hypothetical protein